MKPVPTDRQLELLNTHLFEVRTRLRLYEELTQKQRLLLVKAKAMINLSIIPEELIKDALALKASIDESIKASSID